MRSCTALCLLLFALAASVSAQDTVQVKTGWNIIGSVKAGAVPDVLTTDPPGIITTAFFGYDPGIGYSSTDTLAKGSGYWVKTSSDGVVVFSTSAVDDCGNTTVVHEGVTYRTVRIGSQCWLDRNLNAGTQVSSFSDQLDDGILEKYCHDNIPLNCDNYGGLYQWDEAMQYVATPGVRGICPPGWHVPTVAEFQTLSSTFGGDGNALKAITQGVGSGFATDTSGFSAFLTSYRDDSGFFSPFGFHASFWSSTETDATNASYLWLMINDGDIDRIDFLKDRGHSVRCIGD